jgi:hypothetical protein
MNAAIEDAKTLKKTEETTKDAANIPPDSTKLDLARYEPE